MINISPSSSQNSFRRRRLQALRRITDDYIAAKGSCSIIDLGGTTAFWKIWKDAFDFDRVFVHCINLVGEDGGDAELANIRFERADACHLPEVADGQYDLAFSNSVIEHVGTWAQKRAFAGEARRIARSYAIQTPSFSFPIEPHARMPFIHWLPDPLRYRIHLMRRTGFYAKAATIDDAMRALEDATMLDQRQMRALFPDAQIEKERFLLLTKSFTAIRHVSPVMG